MIRILGAHAAQLLNPIISKLCYSFYMVITPHNLKILLSLLLLSHPTISTFYQPATWNFFVLVILLNLFVDRQKLCVNIITLINNTIVFVSHNAICFGCFTPMSHGVNKKVLPVVSAPPPPPYQVFTRLFCYFTSNILSRFSLIRLLQKIIHFQRKLIFFSQLIAGWF